MPDAIWRLRPGVHAALCGEDLVLLDVAQDQYFCLPEGGRHAVLDAASGRLEGLDPAMAEDLLEADLIGIDDGANLRRTAIVPQRDLLQIKTEPRADAAPRLLAAALAMSWRFRGRAFSTLLMAAAGRRQDARVDVAAAAAIAETYRALLPWLPVQGACLYQSCQLFHALAGAGLWADWVFAVRTWPFRAHCWIQVDDLVLNDTVDHVASYDPILVV
jgi:hypothetical protein